MTSIRSRTRIRKLFTIAVRPRFWLGALEGVYPASEHESFPLLRDAATVIDIGASRGQFVLFALSHFPDALVYAFEPYPPAFARLTRLVRKYGATRRVIATNVAIGERTETAVLHVAQQDDSSSLLPITALQTAFAPETHEVDTLTVPVRRLDELLASSPIRRPALVKVDVQGFELNVLRGARAVLDQVDQVLVEVSNAELYRGQALAPTVTAFLEDCGFVEITRRVSATRNGEALQADVLFERPRRG